MGQGFLRGHSQLQPAIKGLTLNQNATNRFNTFTLGSAWDQLRIRLKVVLTHGTGSSAVTDGLYRMVKGITLSDNLGRYFYNHIHGLFLLHYNTVMRGIAPVYTTFAATTGTYYADIVLPFSGLKMLRGRDTIFNTRSLNNLNLEIDLGGVDDLLGTAGTDTMVVTADIMPESVYGVWPSNVEPQMWVDFQQLSPLDPSSQTIMKVDRANDYLVKRLWLYTANSATLGTNYSGAAANTTLANVTVDTQRQLDVNAVSFLELQAINTELYKITIPTGVAVVDFVPDGSNYSALVSALTSRFDIVLTTGTLSTSQVMCVVEGLRNPGLSKR